MKIAVATDHAGFAAKEVVKTWLQQEGFVVIDFGAKKVNPKDDYPDFITPAAKAVAEGKVERAIIFGGSGQGEAIAANRIPGVRAAVFYGGNKDIISLSREHNDANVLSIGARFVEEKDLTSIVETWLDKPFSTDPRYLRRITKVDPSVSPRWNRLVEQMGWTGVALVVAAYALNVLGILEVTSTGYLLANIVGSLGIMIDAKKDGNTQAVVLNLIWLLIALLGIVQYLMV